TRSRYVWPAVRSPSGIVSRWPIERESRRDTAFIVASGWASSRVSPRTGITRPVSTTAMARSARDRRCGHSGLPVLDIVLHALGGRRTAVIPGRITVLHRPSDPRGAEGLKRRRRFFRRHVAAG